MSDIVVTRETPLLAVVALNRPNRRNAVTREMWREMGRIFTVLGQDPEVRTVILTGTGEHFCAGADLGEFDVSPASAVASAAYDRDVDNCTQTLMMVPKPTIAAISGFCIGGGWALTMACDFRIAHVSARFRIPAARLGIVYGTLDTRNLLTLVGLPRAKEIMFTGRQLDANEAMRMGCVDQVVEGTVRDAAIAFAAPMIENAPLSIAGTKLVLNGLTTGEGQNQSGVIEAAMRRAWESEDYVEGIQAFRERRRPRFTGR
jgi:enoyl-CoA hydratase/carnithine racemase